jgi:GNAT superfamily N-acetyltransferase
LFPVSITLLSNLESRRNQSGLTEWILVEGYDVVAGTPSPEEYRQLRVHTGLSAKSAEGARIGLPNTFFGVTIYHSGTAVGMGRIVGDGGLPFQIVDIAVEPEHQGHGLGKLIVSMLVEHLKKSAPSGAHVSLIADGEAHRLYSQFGFRANCT